MSRPRRAVPFFAIVALVALVGCAPQSPEFSETASFDEALTLAASRDDVVLVDFYATWCGPCKRFSADLEENEALREAIAPAVFVRVDAESEDGGEALAEEYGVTGYPTFVVLDAEGSPVARWSGYGNAEGFTEQLAGVLADPVTIDARVARFESEPTVKDAETLAAYFDDAGEAEQAVDYYREAIDLDPDARGTYLGRILAVQIGSVGPDDAFTADDVLATLAEMEEAEGTDPYDIANAARMLAMRSEQDESLEPAFLAVLPVALERTAPSDEPAAEGEDTDGPSYLDRIHTDLLLAKAIRVDGDLDGAVEIKRASMQDGWTDDPQALNDFAWWCFENEVNLDEALELAQRGAELAEPGSDRAMILDTVAELCNLRGDCGEAILWIEKAIAEDPDREYYAEQKARFEKLLAEANGGSAAAGMP